MACNTFDLKKVIDSPEAVSSEVIDLSPALLKSRRVSDADLRVAVMDEIVDHKHYHRIEKILSNPDLSQEIKSVLSDARYVLASALGGHMMNQVLKQECAQLQEALEKEPLTGLWRKDFFKKYVDQLLESQKNIQKLSFVMADIDHFKKINDKYGHQAGDFVLRTVGEIIRNNTRFFDYGCRKNEDTGDISKSSKLEIASRYGGEEFVFLLQGTDEVGAYEFAERLRGIIEKYEFKYVNEESGEEFIIPVTMSFGVTQHQEVDENFGILCARGDRAMYAAKERGRNQVCVAEFGFTPSNTDVMVQSSSPLDLTPLDVELPSNDLSSVQQKVVGEE